MKKLIFICLLLFSSFLVTAQEIGDTLWTYNFNNDGVDINGALFTPDGQYILALGGAWLYKFDLSGKIVSHELSPTGIWPIIKFSNDGKYFCDKQLNKYDYQTFKKIDSLKGHDKYKPIAYFTFNEENDLGIITYGDENRYTKIKFFQVFKPSTMTVIDTILTSDTIADFHSVAISPDGKYIAFSTRMMKDIPFKIEREVVYNRVEICDANEMKRIKILQSDKAIEVKNIQFSNDGKYIAYSGENYLNLYKLEDFSLVKNFDYTSEVSSFMFSFNNKYLYIGGDGIFKYNLMNFELLKIWKQPAYSIFLVESPNTQILLGCHKGNITLQVLDNGNTSVPSDNNQQNRLLITPNPASDYIQINVGAGSKPALENPEIVIYNVFGEKESTSVNFVDTSASGGHFKIDVSNLAPGVYFIKIGDKFEKFVKM